MKTNTGKRLLCCLFAALFVLCCFPLQCTAERQPGSTIVFSTFEELRNYCDEANGFSGGLLLSCEEEDLVISGDLVIPAGRVVVCRYFTIPAYITLTVMQGAELMTYGLTVQGELINHGTVFQGELSADGETQDAEIVARIPGKVRNKGEMTLTDVFGQRNIDWLGSRLTIIETDSYNEKLKAEVEKSLPVPSATPVPEVTPTPSRSEELRRQALEIFDKLEVILPRLVFFFMLASLGMILKALIADRKKQKKASGSTFSSPEKMHRAASKNTISYTQEYTDFSREDHFQRDREKRMAQLEDWLRSGIIDRKEYNELKKRYEQKK